MKSTIFNSDKKIKVGKKEDKFILSMKSLVFNKQLAKKLVN